MKDVESTRASALDTELEGGDLAHMSYDICSWRKENYPPSDSPPCVKSTGGHSCYHGHCAKRSPKISSSCMIGIGRPYLKHLGNIYSMGCECLSATGGYEWRANGTHVTHSNSFHAASDRRNFCSVDSSVLLVLMRSFASFASRCAFSSVSFFASSAASCAALSLSMFLTVCRVPCQRHDL